MRLIAAAAAGFILSIASHLEIEVTTRAAVSAANLVYRLIPRLGIRPGFEHQGVLTTVQHIELTR